MITLQFTPWAPFHAHKDQATISAWLQSIGDAGTRIFRGGMGHHPPASAPGAWPNNRTGSLSQTIRSLVTNNSVTIGTSMPYSGYLAQGTSKMASRKMSIEAMQEAQKSAHLEHWVRWVHG